MKISGIYPGYIRGYGVGYACQSIIEAMAAAGAECRLHCVTADAEAQSTHLQCVMSPWAKSVGYRLLSQSKLQSFCEWRFRQSLARDVIAYLWPGTSYRTFVDAKSHAKLLVTENINTHQSTAKDILDREYARLGRAPSHGITVRAIDNENALLEMADYVFSPSECVTASLMAAKVPRTRILSSSYGLGRSDIADSAVVAARSVRDHVSAIFVGRIGIRKGAHLLLDYWTKASVKGTLKLIGPIEPDAEALIAPYLGRPDVQFLGFRDDLRAIYEEADIFLFPSLEEGSPLVTYLSLGAGLVSIVSPMGGGGIVRHGISGYVLDPHDEGAWIEAIHRVISNKELRLQLGKSAWQIAPQYLWENVGRCRTDQLSEAMGVSIGPIPAT